MTNIQEIQKSFLFILSALLLINNIYCRITDAERVISNGTKVKELNEEEFLQFNKTNIQYIIYFYEHWNTQCLDLNPVYDRVSVENPFPNLKFGRIHGLKFKNISEEWGIEKYPAVFLVNNEDIDEEKEQYFGPSNTKSIMKFINSRLNSFSEELSDMSSNKINSGKKIVFVGDVKKFADSHKLISKVAKYYEIQNLYWSKSNDFFQKYQIEKDSFDVIFYDSEDNEGERMYITNYANKREIEKWFEIYTRKAYVQIDNHNLEVAVENISPTPTLMFIYSKNDTKINDYSEMFNNLVTKYKRDFWFMNTTIESSHGELFKDVFGIRKTDTPFLVLVSYNENNNDDVDKYVLNLQENKLSSEIIEQFLQNFKEEKLNKFIYSDKTPDEILDEDGITTVVGNTYEELVLNNFGNDVLLSLCIKQSSKRCKQLRLRLERVAKKLKNNPNLIIAEMDIASNEFSHITYDKIPTLVLIPGYSTKEERVQNIVYYDREFSTQKISEFLVQKVNRPLSKYGFLPDEKHINKEEKSTVIKRVLKEREEEMGYEDGITLGLRRTIRKFVDESDREFINEDYIDQEDDDYDQFDLEAEEPEEYETPKKQKDDL